MKMELDLLWLILATVIGSCVLLFGYLRRVNEWYYVTKLGAKGQSLPPGDMGWPLLGNSLAFLKAFRSNDPDSFINNLVDRYHRTGIYKTHLFGRPSIIVCTPETCRRVLTDDEHFVFAYPSCAARLSGKRTFIHLSKSEHRHLRKLMTTPMIGHEVLAMYMGGIEGIVKASFEEWAALDRPIEFWTETRIVAFKMILNILLGSACNLINVGSMEKYYGDLHKGFHSSVAINMPGLAFHKALKARGMLVKIFRKVLDDRRGLKKSDEQKAGGRGMIDLLMEAEDESGQRLEDEEIADLLITLLLAGHDSPANLAMWTTIYLHRHPQFLQKAKEEQEEIVKKRPSGQKGLTLEEIKRMKYLVRVIDETLRIMSVPFSELRAATTDVDIKGYVVPKGWKVFIWNRSVHMDPVNYPAPKEFDPSRWDNQVAEPGSFIPFGGGQRRCLGADLGKLETSIFVHYFLLNYKLEQLNPQSPTVYLAAKPKDNCLARVIKLKSSSTISED